MKLIFLLDFDTIKYIIFFVVRMMICVQVPQMSLYSYYMNMFLPVNFMFQLLAYHLTVQRGYDVDQPRNLAKSVTTQ